MASITDKILKDIDSAYGGNIVETGVEKNDYDRIPFSSPRLNYMTFGGIPMGHIVEFSGPEGSGKTSTAVDIMKNAQIKFDKMAKETGEEPKKIVFIDVEGTFDYTWSSKFGLDKLLEGREIGLVVLDSIASMIPEQLESKGVGEKIYGGLAQSLQNFCLKAGRYLREDNVSIICINQVRDNLNSMFGGTITPRR